MENSEKICYIVIILLLAINLFLSVAVKLSVDESNATLKTASVLLEENQFSDYVFAEEFVLSTQELQRNIDSMSKLEMEIKQKLDNLDNCKSDSNSSQ